MDRHFLREFACLTGQPAAPAADSTVQRVLKRLAVIQSLLTLHKTENLPKHLDRRAADPRLAARSAYRYMLRAQKSPG